LEKFFGINPATGKPIPQQPQKAQPTAAQPNDSYPPILPEAPRLPPLKAIVSDCGAGGLHTKSALASIILQFTSVLSPALPPAAGGAVVASASGSTPPSSNALLIEHLLPLILNLLNDEHAEVRLGLIAKLGEEGAQQQQQQQAGGGSGVEAMKNVLSIDVLSSSLLPALSKLASDLKWRTRLQTIHLIPNLAAYFQADFFNAKLFDVVLAWLGDSIWSIREAAILNLVRLTQLFGSQWAVQRLLPKLKALSSDKSYVFRLTSVFAMKELAHVLGAAIVTAELLPTILQLSKDAVPNVRFNVARLLGYLVKEQLVTSAANAATAAGATQNAQQGGGTSGNAVAAIEQALVALQEDSDADVKYCAHQALREAFGRP
jgi:serine/threonine-protein phosphatase 2A regulatory subunit A